MHPNVLEMFDAQRAMGFLLAQATYIETPAYEMRYPDITYQQFIPVDTSAPEWVKTITYFSTDAAGRAAWFSGQAQDVPHVGLVRDKVETTVHMGAIGYDYNLEELGTAMLYNLNLNADKALVARRVAEEMIERVAYTGDVSKGLTGLFNATTPTADTVPADGTGSATTFASKTPDQVLRDVNAALAGQFTSTLGAEIADTVMFPYSILLDLSTRRIDTQSKTTILQWLEENNIYTRQTRQPLTIVGHWGLETAGSGGTKRMMAYRKSPDVLKMHMPMPFQFLPAWQTGPMIFEVPGIFRLGGVDIKRPKAVRYRDGL